MKRIVFGVLVFLSFILLITGNSYAAETTASIIGTVQDDKGGPLPGATIMAVNTATNFRRNTTTEENGSYRVALLPSGTYDVTVEVAGFAKEVQRNIILTVGKEIILDFKLKLSVKCRLARFLAEGNNENSP